MGRGRCERSEVSDVVADKRKRRGVHHVGRDVVQLRGGVCHRHRDPRAHGAVSREMGTLLPLCCSGRPIAPGTEGLWAVSGGFLQVVHAPQAAPPLSAVDGERRRRSREATLVQERARRLRRLRNAGREHARERSFARLGGKRRRVATDQRVEHVAGDGRVAAIRRAVDARSFQSILHEASLRECLVERDGCRLHQRAATVAVIIVLLLRATRGGFEVHNGHAAARQRAAALGLQQKVAVGQLLRKFVLHERNETAH
mmetsp:Transcript_47235/g.145703  ORF Transcript_47235/g.145703 Transcript_47235/m.145703 type:complete len:257 (-) Transcript_47235:1126-1896(-)